MSKYKFKVDDKVIINKPNYHENQDNAPHWLDEMDCYDKSMATIKRIVSARDVELDISGDYVFHHSWLEPVANNQPAVRSGVVEDSDSVLRPYWTDVDISEAVNFIKSEVDRRVQQKGRHIFASSHEILGLLSEEYTEFHEAVGDNADAKNKVAELADIAVVCILGIAAYHTGKMNW